VVLIVLLSELSFKSFGNRNANKRCSIVNANERMELEFLRQEVGKLKGMVGVSLNYT
jgi:hypothetical protein